MINVFIHAARYDRLCPFVKFFLIHKNHDDDVSRITTNIDITCPTPSNDISML